MPEGSVRVLLTGSSGFIGGHLVEVLRERGHVVVGVDRERPQGPEPDDFVHGDLLDDGILDGVLRGVDCVFHLAASKDDWGISRQEYFRDNVAATERLIAAGRRAGVGRWFHYSTVGVLPAGAGPKDEGADYDPETDYGASKAEAEKCFHELSQDEPGAEIMILRPSAVFGPRNPETTNVHRLIEAIRAGRFVMVGDGQTRKTTSYIHNLTAVTLFLISEFRPGVQIFHYVDNPVMTTEKLVELIYQELSKSRPRWRIPRPVAESIAYLADLAAAATGIDLPITGARIAKFCTPTNFDASAIRERGFTQPVPNEEAVAKTVRWHHQHVGNRASR